MDRCQHGRSGANFRTKGGIDQSKKRPAFEMLSIQNKASWKLHKSAISAAVRAAGKSIYRYNRRLF
jgi:hypothetical protein